MFAYGQTGAGKPGTPCASPALSARPAHGSSSGVGVGVGDGGRFIAKDFHHVWPSAQLIPTVNIMMTVILPDIHQIFHQIFNHIFNRFKNIIEISTVKS